MNKFIVIIILLSLFSCSMKNGNFKCKCENIKEVKGINSVSFEYGKGVYEGESSELLAYFKVDTSMLNCFNYRFYFEGVNDTLKVDGDLEGYTIYTSNELNQHLESNEKLMLRIIDSCNQTINIVAVDCQEIKEKIRLVAH